MSAFRDRLHREILDETYPMLSMQEAQAETPTPPDLSGQPVSREGNTVTRPPMRLTSR